jgi:hypothetical protein
MLRVAGLAIPPYPVRPACGVSFPGCSNWGGPAGACACETWRPTWCPVCDRDLKDGDLIVERAEWIGGEGYRCASVHAGCHPGVLRRLGRLAAARRRARRRRRRR